MDPRKPSLVPLNPSRINVQLPQAVDPRMLQPINPQMMPITGNFGGIRNDLRRVR